MSKVYFITGAGRGMGVDFARAALEAGHRVEEISDEQFRAQLEVNLFGTLDVTRAVLPVMRRQRSGQVVTMSSTAGVVATECTSAYAASKFALEGWMEALRPEVAPYGISTTVIEPGFFRTELLEPASTTWPALSVPDYAPRTAQTIPAWESMNGKQSGDPAKLARALVALLDGPTPPERWVAGADAVAVVEQKARTLLEQVHAHRDLSTSLAHDDVGAAA